jgi:hypothetical protein
MTTEGSGMSLVVPPFTKTFRKPHSPSRWRTWSVATDSRRIPVYRRIRNIATSRGRFLCFAASTKASMIAGPGKPKRFQRYS